MEVLSLLLLWALALPPQGNEHPILLPADLDPAKCVECHADKQQGKHVHSAISMGCTTCHEVQTESNQTRIKLIAARKELCGTCHEAKQAARLHWPYKGGHCLACHDPHSSNFPKVVRAQTNTLCFSCHGINQPGVTFDRQAKTVTVLGGEKLTFDEYNQAKKIGLDRSERSGHPIMGHPIEGRDPRNKDSALSCLSCHTPHGSTLQALLPDEVKNDIELCGQCHK